MAGADGRRARAALLLLAALTAACASEPDTWERRAARFEAERVRSVERGACEGSPFAGVEVDSATVVEAAAAHALWLEAGRSDTVPGARRADFCGADLDLIRLRGLDLSWADFRYVSATNAFLSGLVLRGANFSEADLSSLYLGRSDVTGAAFLYARMRNAYFSGSVADSAWFNGSDLYNMSFGDGSLRGASFEEADVSRMDLQVDRGGAPDATAFYGVKGMHTVRGPTIPVTLMELRDDARQSGMDHLVRDLTYAIWHDRRMESPVLQRVSMYWFFEFTTEFGRRPERALFLLLALIPGFAVGYLALILRGGRRSVVTVEYQGRSGRRRRRRVPVRARGRLLSPRALAWNAWLALRISLASAFSVGQRSLDVGHWLNRLQTRDYTFVTHGAARTLSGLQALVSFYLVTVWLLMLFRNPFQ